MPTSPLPSARPASPGPAIHTDRSLASLNSGFQSHTPLRTSTLDPKDVENLRPRLGCKTPSLQPLTATPCDVSKRNTPKGVSVRCNNVPFAPPKPAPCTLPPRCTRKPQYGAPTSTRTSQYLRSCVDPCGAKPLAPLHLPPRLATHEAEHCVYCCASLPPGPAPPRLWTRRSRRVKHEIAWGTDPTAFAV